ncbi:hypothetical protein AC1031_004603 [Aphanomyces cochlioides]|nr:hypothetical protein AC1031_004603 [Aphanomyces cochlioides]
MLRRKPDYEYAKGLVETYFTMLIEGCGDAACRNAVCHSNPQAPRLDATQAAIQSILLAVEGPTAICLKTESRHQPTTDDVPETEEDEDEEEERDVVAAPSTPRKRLAIAVKLDTTLNKPSFRRAVAQLRNQTSPKSQED